MCRGNKCGRAEWIYSVGKFEDLLSTSLICAFSLDRSIHKGHIYSETVFCYIYGNDVFVFGGP